jgi:branched-chain amino acid transport system ATP-binding protein
MLKLSDVVAGYGPLQVLRRVSLEVQQGEIVCLLGGNAAGKSTTLKTVLGLLRPSAGSVALEGERIDGPHRGHRPARNRAGAGVAPIFARMTVWRTLMGA